MHLRRFHFLIALVYAASLATIFTSFAYADGPITAPNPAQVENKTCLACHSNRELTMKLPGGETLSVYTDEAQFNASVHGKQGQRCTTCHANITAYPHPAPTARDKRDFSLQMYTVCKQCHEKVYQQAIDSIHSKDIAAGNRNAAVCTDCHTAHYVTHSASPRSRIPQTCRQCHSTIFDQYKSSVHGAALLDQSNPDVPTCVECHGVHQIADPTTNAFRLKSPEICATCHTDKAKMKKYNLSANVLNTYVADFHGSTVELFEKQSPSAPTNKAVCYDCHGVHDIRSVKDPKSSVVKENILKTCQQCHPDATTDFPSSWMSHYDASPTKYPAVYYVNLFYTVLIPVVIGGMLAFVLLDAARRILNRAQKSGSH
ncbi:MAG: cytochrome c3 family protein [Anaerolineales bacterium]|nr:cytochrome c3 family protein [Anaerolineales bacterium]